MELLQHLLNGLRSGSIYALIALGYTMVYGIIRLINFAHGDVVMLSAYAISIAVLPEFGISGMGAVLIAMPIAVIAAISVEKVAYRSIKTFRLSHLIGTIGMSLLFRNLVKITFGANSRTVKTSLFPDMQLDLGGVYIDTATLVTILTALVIMFFLRAFTKTALGRSMRALASNRTAATLCGVNAEKITVITYATGAVLASIAAYMYLMQYPAVRADMGAMLGIKAFSAAVLGGIGIIPGAMLGGFLIGIAEALTRAYISRLTGGLLSSAFSDSIVFSVLVAVLLVKPSGILGRKAGERL